MILSRYIILLINFFLSVTVLCTHKIYPPIVYKHYLFYSHWLFVKHFFSFRFLIQNVILDSLKSEILQNLEFIIIFNIFASKKKKITISIITSIFFTNLSTNMFDKLRFCRSISRVGHGSQLLKYYIIKYSTVRNVKRCAIII